MSRDYNYIPRPEIEYHHHIQDLIEAQEKKADDRNYHRNKAKEKEERDALIKDAKGKETKEFWCPDCKKDFIGEAIKQVEVDWSCPTQNIAFYKTKCFNNHWCMRLITDRHKDAYWFKSRKVKMEQGSYFADTIQPYETGFNMLYKKI